MSRTLTAYGDRLLVLVGDRLRGVRKRRKWTLEKLASRTGMSAAQISRMECGKVGPSLLTLLEYSQVFGVSLKQLVPSVRELKTRPREENVHEDD